MKAQVMELVSPGMWIGGPLGGKKGREGGKAGLGVTVLWGSEIGEAKIIVEARNLESNLNMEGDDLGPWRAAKGRRVAWMMVDPWREGCWGAAVRMVRSISKKKGCIALKTFE